MKKRYENQFPYNTIYWRTAETYLNVFQVITTDHGSAIYADKSFH